MNLPNTNALNNALSIGTHGAAIQQAASQLFSGNDPANPDFQTLFNFFKDELEKLLKAAHEMHDEFA